MKHKVDLTNDTCLSQKKQKRDESPLKQNGATHDVFTSLEFKNLLKEPETQIHGLNKFCKACEKFDAKKENALDIVKSYIGTSPDCVEIFKCFGAQNSAGVFGPIFRSIICILTRTAGDLKELYGKVGVNICSGIVQSHLQKVYRALAFRKSPRTVTSALRLLTIIVMQGKDSARDVANNVDFSLRCFKEILEFSKGKMGYEVRLCYIKFILSFFVSDDSQTMKRILESQGTVSAIFRGLKSDPASIVQLVLTTLKEKAIKNMLVPKTAKAHFFAEPKLLSRISSLFEWDGVPDIALDNPADSMKDYIRQLVYEFLYHACCPFKYGINFRDKMLGIGEKSKNHVLLDFIIHLVPSTSDSLVRDLVAEVLKTCADLLPRFINDFRLSLEPKDEEVWIRNFRIIEAAYEIQPDVATALSLAASTRTTNNNEDKIPCESLVNMTLPGVFAPNFTTQSAARHCLKCKSFEIRRKSLSLIILFLKKIKATLEFALLQSNWEKSIYSYDEIEFMVAELKDRLLKNYVSVPLIMSFWNEISGGNLHELINLLLQILSLLQTTFPNALVEAKLDFTKLLNGIKISPQSTCQDEFNSAVLTLKMLSQVVSQCRWFKSGEDKSIPFQKLLQVIYDSKNFKNGIHEEAVSLFQKIIVSNKIVGLDKSQEAQIWVSYLVPEVKTHNDTAVLNFLTDICGRVARMPINYIKILSSQQHGNDAMDNMPKVGEDFWSSLPDVEIQPADSKDLLENTKCVEVQNIDGADLKESMDETVYSVSLLTVAVLYSLRDITSLGSEECVLLDRYLTDVLSSIFHILPSAEDAKFFACVFTEIVGNIPDIETNFTTLVNFSRFLSIWSGHVVKGFNPQINDPKDSLDGWMWNIFAKKKKGQAPAKKFPFAYPSDDAECQYQVQDMFPQCLLYFDSLMNLGCNQKIDTTDAAKKLLCFIISMLQRLLKLQMKNHSILRGEKKETASPEHTDSPDSMCHEAIENLTLWQYFLQTPSVQKLFFNDVRLLCTTEIDFLHMAVITSRKEDNSLSEICTYAVVSALKARYIDSKYPLDDCAKIFMSQIIHLIPELLGELSTLRKSTGNAQYLLLSAFKNLKPLIPSEDVQFIFNSTSRLLPKVKVGEVATVFSDLLFHCTSSIINCNATKVSYSAFTAIFDFIQSDLLVDRTKMLSIIINFLDNFPAIAAIAPTSLLDFCFQNPDPLAASLAAKLLQCNPCLISHWCSSQEKFLDLNLEGKIRIVPAMSQILKVLTTHSLSESEINGHSLKKILKAYKKVLCCDDIAVIFKILKKEGGSEFLEHCLMASRKLDHVSHLTGILERIDEYGSSNFEEVAVLCKILVKVSESSLEASNLKVIVILTLLKLISAAKDEKYSTLYCELLSMVEKLAMVDHLGLREKVMPVWTKFLKHTLKNYFQNKTALQCLNEIIPMIYDGIQSSDISGNLPNLATIRSMVISHSKFLPIIFNDNLAKQVGEMTLKDALTDLLFLLTLHCSPDELSDKDLGFLLGAYGCTLSCSDQTILKIIFVYEQKGINLSNFKPFLWGRAALSSYRARKKLGDTLWKRPGPSEVLSCIDRTIMDSSLARFPLRRRMLCMDQDIKDETFFKNDGALTIVAAKNEIRKYPQISERVYDPCFLLPAIFELLNPENLVDCKLFVQSGAFSFLMCCLSSHCHIIRSLSATCLSLYYQHAQTAWFSENNLTMYMIRCIRNSLEPKEGKDEIMVIPRLSSVVANFFSSLVSLHFTPDDHMFAVLHRFLLVKPQFDLKNVPEFFVLFFSAEMESKVERTWILNLISQSLRDMGDYHVIKKKNVFQLLMCLHDSPISDNYSRRQVFEIIEQTCTIRSAANDLVKNNGLVSWLTEVASQQPCRGFDSDDIGMVGIMGKRQENTNHVIRIMSTLWRTLNLSDFVAEDIFEKEDREDADEEKRDKHATLAPFRVVKQLISLAVVLVGNLSLMSNVDESDGDFLTETLSVLESCLANLDERRKWSSTRRKESLDNVENDASDLQEGHIMTLLTIVDSSGHQGMRSLVKTFTFWEPRSTMVMLETHEYKLWAKCVVWVLGPAFEAWSGDSIWVEKNLIKFLTWSQKWTLHAKAELDISMKRFLTKCYSVICHHISTLGAKSFECIKILNDLLSHGYCAAEGSKIFALLNEMQAIRNRILPDE